MVFLEYIPGDSLFHRLDIRSKLLWFIAVNVLAFLFWDPIYVGIILFSVILAGTVAQVPFRRFGTLMKGLIIPMIFIVGYEALVYPGEHILFYIIPELWGFGPYGQLTIEGLFVGLTFLFRLLIMVFSSSIFTLTTPLDHFLGFLQKIRAPYQLGFMIAVAVRFIPTLQREAWMIIDAQKARGAEIEASKGFLQTIKMYVPIFLPMIINGIRRSETLAMAMVTRGFGVRKWKPLKSIKLTKIDYIFIPICLVLLFIGIYLWIKGYGVITFWGG